MHRQPLIRQLCGQDRSLIDCDSLPVAIHRMAVKPFQSLQLMARSAGFDLVIASGYRDFDRQLMIWNDKALGKRPVYDNDGKVLDITCLSPWQLVQSILRWSALPGASRHHWGSDIDVYDRAAVPENYSLQLSEQEVQAGGPFAALHDWLDEQIASGNAQGFFRPYAIDRGGIAAERWHLSYAPVAVEYQRALSPGKLVDMLLSQPLQLKACVSEHFDEIYQRYIDVPMGCYPDEFQPVAAG